MKVRRFELPDVHLGLDSLPHTNTSKPRSANLPMTMHILIVTHNTQLYHELGLSLEQKGYTIHLQPNGAAALKSLITQSFDLVILNLELPGYADLEFCVELRKNSRIPLILFMHPQQTEQLVQALELGADAVIAIPFIIKEAEARIAAILRRSNGPYTADWLGGAFTDLVALEEILRKVNNPAMNFTPIAARLLSFLLEHLHQTMTKEQIYTAVWGNEVCGVNNVVEVAVRRLREKIEENPSMPQYLLTVRGIGYKFTLPNHQQYGHRVYSIQ